MTRDQDIRKEVLEQLKGRGISISAQPAQIARIANRSGFDSMTEREALEACLFLVDGGHAVRVESPDGAAHFRITRAGILAWEAMQS